MFVGSEKNVTLFTHGSSGHGGGSSGSTYGQEYLQRGVSHLDELEVHQAARYGDVAVVLGRPRRRGGDGGHLAAGAVLHPPGAMHGQVERQHQVRVLQGKTKGFALVFKKTSFSQPIMEFLRPSHDHCSVTKHCWTQNKNSNIGSCAVEQLELGKLVLFLRSSRHYTGLHLY